MNETEQSPKVLSIRIMNVPFIDATGLRVLKQVHQGMKAKGYKLIPSEINNDQVLAELQEAHLSAFKNND